MSGPNYDSEEVERALAGNLAPYHSAFVLAQEVRRLRGEYERLAEAAQTVVGDLLTAAEDEPTDERLRTMIVILARILERALPAAEPLVTHVAMLTKYAGIPGTPYHAAVYFAHAIRERADAARVATERERARCLVVEPERTRWPSADINEWRSRIASGETVK